jgi:hypothetical protein
MNITKFKRQEDIISMASRINCSVMYVTVVTFVSEPFQMRNSDKETAVLNY